MELFKKRETTVENITYLGIMAAINVIFVLLTNVLPVLFFLIVFVLPLTSAVVTLFCKKIYFPIYFIVTLALCFLVNLGFHIFDTFLYVFPSLITGFLFGYMAEKKCPVLYIILLLSLFQFGFNILTFLFIDRLIGNVSLFSSLMTVFGLGSFTFKTTFAAVFVYIIAVIQIIFTYILISTQIKKLGFEFNLEDNYHLLQYIVLIFFLVAMVLGMFFYVDFALVFLVAMLPIPVNLAVSLIMKKKLWIIISLGASLLASMFVLALVYNYVSSPNQLCLIASVFVFITIIDFLENYCFNSNNKATNIQ